VLSLPGVSDCAVIGVPDESNGEAVKLLIVRADSRLDGAAVLAHCRERLTPYKCPKQVEFRAALPKTPIGKVLKRELRDH